MDIATVDKLLTTTRSVRKRLDLTRAVDPQLVAECLEIAVQAPTGSNLQGSATAHNPAPWLCAFVGRRPC